MCFMLKATLVPTNTCLAWFWRLMGTLTLDSTGQNSLRSSLPAALTNRIRVASVQYETRRPDPTQFKNLERLARSVIEPEDYLERIEQKMRNLKHEDNQLVSQEDEEIMADLLVLYAVTANCTTYFQHQSMHGATELYMAVKNETIDLFNQHCTNTTPEPNDAGYLDTRAERLLVKPNSRLRHQTVFALIYYADLTDLFHTEEVENILQHTYYGYIYNKKTISWSNWRFWITFVKWIFFKS